MKTLNVIGCGRVGQTIARLARERANYCIQDLYSRSKRSAVQACEFIGDGRVANALQDMRPADLWMLTVPDSAIRPTAEELRRNPSIVSTQENTPVAFHCSGFFPASVLEPLRDKGFALGSVHPCLNFASAETGISQFENTPCGIEGDAQAADLLQDFFALLGGRCFAIDSKSKTLYHTAAVFCSNFTVVLQGIARETWREAGIPDRVINQVLPSLLNRTVTNITDLGPHAAITGPAARGDREIVEEEKQALEQWHLPAADLYDKLSLMASNLARSGSVFSSHGAHDNKSKDPLHNLP